MTKVKTETKINEYEEFIEIRDIINRVEEIEEQQPLEDDDDLAELKSLKSLLSELAADIGDEKWNGDWYPGPLIRDSYFEEFAEQLVSDCGDLPIDIPSYVVIDWGATARNLWPDYSSVEFNGVTYWYR